MEYDIIIIGTTIDRITSAIYLLKLGKRVLLIESYELKEYVKGFEKFKDFSLKKYIGLEKSIEQILKLGGKIKNDEIIEIRNNEVITNNEIYKSKAIIIAMGSRYKLLGLENEEKFIEKGIHFCISCDAPFYKNEIGCVVGFDDSALEKALSLSNICREVIIINKKNNIIGSKKILEKVYKKNNIKVYNKTKIISLNGEDKLEKVIISNNKEINVDCIFFSNGLIPNIEIINIKKHNDGIFIIDKASEHNTENGISVAKKAIEFIKNIK